MTWTQRTWTASTDWEERANYQIDTAYLLTDLSEIITNDNDERIVFHNWDYYDWTNNWYERPELTTNWT